MIGDPGRYARRTGRADRIQALQWRLVWLAAIVGACAGGLMTVSAWIGHRSPVAGVALAGAGAITSWLAGTRASAAEQRAGRRTRGATAEATVVAELQRAGVALVVNGAELGAGGDADHVVMHVSRPGVGALAVIETKAGGGTVRPQGHSLATGRAGRVIPGDPVAQATRQATALRRKTGLTVHPIVCVPGMTNAPFSFRGATVCGQKDLGAIVTGARLQGDLGDWTTQRLAGLLRLKD